MSWSEFYLACFGVGFVLSLMSVLSGSLRLPHVHLNFHGHALPHASFGHGHAGHGAGLRHGASPLHFGTIAAFLAWFGGVGYLVNRFYQWWFPWVLGVAVLSGLAGGAIIFWFLLRVVGEAKGTLDPADFSLIGALGRVSSSIHEGGTGEMIFTQEGRRLGLPVRSESGRAIHCDTEVVVTRYEKGIGYVREWDELTGSLESENAAEH